MTITPTYRFLQALPEAEVLAKLLEGKRILIVTTLISEVPPIFDALAEEAALLEPDRLRVIRTNGGQRIEVLRTGGEVSFASPLSIARAHGLEVDVVYLVDVRVDERIVETIVPGLVTRDGEIVEVQSS